MDEVSTGTMNDYLRKYALRPALIDDWPQEDLGLIVVVPACDESNLNFMLNSLHSCTRPDCSVEIIVIINSSEKASEEVLLSNRNAYLACIAWQDQCSEPGFRVFAYLENDMPDKHAGVGLARKIGMDEAVRRFEKIGNSNGVIACFDADCSCSVNYLEALYAHFRLHPKTPACSINFRHPTFGTEYEPYTYLGITYYELHLRYYNQALRSTGFPYAFHTIGSAMAVRCTAYQKQGGMNRRKAGEDFYFLHKMMALGSFSELNQATVYPSPRPSLRVPFGTGKAINHYLKNPQKGHYTYNLKAFLYLEQFFKNLPEFYLSGASLITLGGTLPYILIDFLHSYFFDERIEEIRLNSANYNSFKKRFFGWFNAFMVLKFVHFVRDNAHSNIRVERAALEFLRHVNFEGVEKIQSIDQLLEVFRRLDSYTLSANVMHPK